ncbi:hypothetical protein [Metamycoplasma canadense]|uniref:Uncharacterized protein n=1 Tax=Metamycoplasma canadense TaxID=29554 RepID=A0A077L5W1_9BACT|nr:hypothetical protein [Metamycoplasma canadense]BAP39387.1 hypothetical protein MCAN360_0115 [Metamycoplasma canadense]
MKKINKFLLSVTPLSLLTTLPLISSSCNVATKEDNKIKEQLKTEYEKKINELSQLITSLNEANQSLDKSEEKIKKQIIEKNNEIKNLEQKINEIKQKHNQQKNEASKSSFNKLKENKQLLEDVNKQLSGLSKFDEKLDNQNEKDTKKPKETEKQTPPASTAKPEPDSKPAETPQGGSSTTPEPTTPKQNPPTTAEEPKQDSNTNDEWTKKISKLTEEQKNIVNKIKDKTIVTNKLNDDDKKLLNELTMAQIKNTNKYYGYILPDAEDTIKFGNKSKEAKKNGKKFTNLKFDESFIKELKAKKITHPMFGINGENRNALSFEKKDNGNFTIPFKFKGSEEIFEIELPKR